MKQLEENAEPLSNPAALYLSTLGTDASRRGMISPLNQAARCLDPTLEGARAWEQTDWTALSAPLIRSIMASTLGRPSTKKKALAALKGVARSAWEMGRLETEAYQRIRGIKSPRGEGEPAGRHILEEEVNALIGVCAQNGTPASRRDASLVWLAYATGARRAELGSLRLNSVEEDEGRLKVNIHGKGIGDARCMWKQWRWSRRSSLGWK